MKVKPRKNSREFARPNSSQKEFKPVVIPLDESNPRASSLKYVSPLGNVTPKKKNKEEQQLTRKKENAHASSFRGVQKITPSAKASKLRKRNNHDLQRKIVKSIHSINDHQSRVEVVDILNAPQSEHTKSDGKKQPLRDSLPLPSTAVTTKAKTTDVNNSKHVQEQGENLTMANVDSRANLMSAGSVYLRTTRAMNDPSKLDVAIDSSDHPKFDGEKLSVSERSSHPSPVLAEIKLPIENKSENIQDVNCNLAADKSGVQTLTCRNQSPFNISSDRPKQWKRSKPNFGRRRRHGVHYINSDPSNIEVIVISDPPKSDLIESDGKKQLLSGNSPVLAMEIEAFPLSNLITEIERPGENSLEHVKDQSTNLITTKMSPARNELSHKKNENVQQDDLDTSSQSVICVDELDGHTSSMTSGSDRKNDWNSVQEKQSFCHDQGTKRKREVHEVCDDLNKSTKKRKNMSITIENTTNPLTETVNKETCKPVNSTSFCTSMPNFAPLETIDLEPDIVFGSNTSALNNTIELSDEESTTNDIIVLGSPVVPSVRSYKAVSKDCRTKLGPNKPLLETPSWLGTEVPCIDLSQNIIARAISKLNNGMTKFGAHLNKDFSSVVASTSAIAPSPNNMYGANIYNPCKDGVKSGLRPVIIDGSNVAMGHGNGLFFSAKGIDICVHYFVKRGHKVFAFVPQFRRGHYNTKDSHLLIKLQSEKHLIFTPSRYVDGQSDVPYDDRYIVQTAAELGGVIVSTDNYRDLMAENVQWHDTIKNRLLMFTWVEDMLIFPQDPLGRRGGTLEEFLRF